MKASLRFEAMKRDGFVCQYCGAFPPHALLEVDHILPKSAGGKDAIDNLITACVDCNRGKGAKLLQEGLASSIGERSIAETRARLEQAKEYAALQAEIEQFTLSQLDDIHGVWAAGFGGGYEKGCYTVGYGFPQESRLRETLKRLPLPDILDAVRVTVDRFDGRPRYQGPIAYFWAVIRNRIAEREARNRG